MWYTKFPKYVTLRTCVQLLLILSLSASSPTPDCPATSTYYPVGIYLGHSRVTSSYYKHKDQPVLVADVAADWRWNTQHSEGSWKAKNNVGTYRNEPDKPGTCSDILPGFLASMKAVIRETSKQLTSSFNIGYVVIPNHLRDYIPIMDEFMHIVFDFSYYPKPDDDLIQYDIITVAEGAQHGYGLVWPYDYWQGKKPEHPHFTEDDYFLYVNVEDDFVEVGCGCIMDPLCGPHSTQMILDDIKQEGPISVTHQEQNTIMLSDQSVWRLWLSKLQISFATVEVVHDIPCLIAHFVEEIPFIGNMGDLRAVVLYPL